MLLLTGCLISTQQEYLALRELALDVDGDKYRWTECEPGECDCDDADPAINPGVAEVCDGIDNNCVDGIDEGLDDYVGWFLDEDGDGFGSSVLPVTQCPVPEDAVQDASDCDDSRSDIFPGADEVCDQADNDCDGDEDEDVDKTWYRDEDGDGYGDDEVTVFGCEEPSGYVEEGGDCDDSDEAISPGLDEVCDDFIDNDCDGGDSGCSWVGDVDAEAIGVWMSSEGGDRAGTVLDGGVPLTGGLQGVLVASPTWDESRGKVYAGAVDLINPEDQDLTAGPTFQGVDPLDAFGSALTLGVDASSDGDRDPLIGAPGAGDAAAGCVYRFERLADTVYGPDDAELVVCGLESQARLGAALAISGFTGDFWTSAPGQSTLYRFPAGITGEVSTEDSDRQITHPAVEDFGAALELVDLDGDGVKSVVVGSPSESVVYVLDAPSVGGVTVVADADIELYAVSDSDFGQHLAAGDLNSDGYGDVVVGVKGGQVSVFFGPAAGDIPDAAANVRTTGTGEFGVSASIAADLNVDRHTDLAVGDPAESTGGAVFLFYGPVTGSLVAGDADVVVHGDAGQGLGTGLVSGGEDVVHWDIVDSLFVGAPGTGALEGGAYHLSGQGL